MQAVRCRLRCVVQRLRGRLRSAVVRVRESSSLRCWGADSTPASSGRTRSVAVRASLPPHSRREALSGAALLVSPLSLGSAAVGEGGQRSLYDLTVSYEGRPYALSAFRDKLTIVVNGARGRSSSCSSCSTSSDASPVASD